MSSSPRIGLVGVGQRGLAHLEAIVALQSEEIATLNALADPFAENLSESKIKAHVPAYSATEVKQFVSGTELLRLGDVDIVWFAIPPNQHRDEVLLPPSLGFPALIEKPQSLFLDEAIQQAQAFADFDIPNRCEISKAL